MKSDDCHDVMLAYVAGCCDDDERYHIERLLAGGDITAQAAYTEAISVLHAVPLAIEPMAPPPHLRKRVLKRCHCRPGAPLRYALYASTGLAACLAVALTMSLVHGSGEAKKWDNVERVMSSRDVTFAKLETAPIVNPTNPARHAYGRVLFCPRSKMFEAHLFDLPPVSAGRVFQMWLITPEKTPLSAGTFIPQPDGRQAMMVQMPPGTNAVAAAITDEPEGGSPIPTGRVILSGSLGN